jgi:tetratricopeptide (TPR) repeat protein
MKLPNILQLLKIFQFSPAQLKLIKKVVTLSLTATLIITGGSWLYFKVQEQRKAAKKHQLENPYSATTLLPLDMEAHRLIAARYMQSGAPEKAIPHLERIHALHPRDYAVTADLAFACLEAGEYRTALGYYDEILAVMPADSITGAQCAQRGAALFYLNKAQESRAALLDCIARHPDNAEAYCFLGQIEANRELPSEKALEYLNKAIALDSSYTEGWYQLGRYYMQVKVYTKARELFQTAIAINPFHSKSHSRLGMVYYYLDYPELARKSYQTALVLNPDDFNTRYNLGELLYGVIGDTIEALREFKQAIELNPKLYEAAFKIGLISMKNNMLKEAVNYFEQALETDPSDQRILLQCAVAYEKLDLKDEAIRLYNAIIAVDPLNNIARQKLKLLGEE